MGRGRGCGEGRGGVDRGGEMVKWTRLETDNEEDLGLEKKERESEREREK